MTRISQYKTSDKAGTLLGNVEKSMGMVPNIFKLMANSANVLEGYLSFSSCLSKGKLSAQDREQIALAVAGYNKCHYCASAHTLLATKAGVSSDEAKHNLKGTSLTPRTSDLISFCVAVLQTQGNVSNHAITKLQDSKFSDEEIVEIVACICINIFTNYFNHVAGTEIDFPEVDMD